MGYPWLTLRCDEHMPLFRTPVSLRRKKFIPNRSNSLTWKWKMAPWKTMFLYKHRIFHFHVSQSECNRSRALFHCIPSSQRHDSNLDSSGIVRCVTGHGPVIPPPKKHLLPPYPPHDGCFGPSSCHAVPLLDLPGPTRLTVLAPCSNQSASPCRVLAEPLDSMDSIPEPG